MRYDLPPEMIARRVSLSRKRGLPDASELLQENLDLAIDKARGADAELVRCVPLQVDLS